MKGQLASSTFKSAPTSVVATSLRGERARAAVEAGGEFVLSLPAGRWKVRVETASGSMPLVMPRLSGRIDHSFPVGNRLVQLGGVHYQAAISQSALTVASVCSDADGECIEDLNQPGCGDGEHDTDPGQHDVECVNGGGGTCDDSDADQPGQDLDEAAVPNATAPACADVDENSSPAAQPD